MNKLAECYRSIVGRNKIDKCDADSLKDYYEEKREDAAIFPRQVVRSKFSEGGKSGAHSYRDPDRVTKTKRVDQTRNAFS